MALTGREASRVPRDLPLSNGNLLVNFDAFGQLRDVYFPHVGMENHTQGGPCRLGVWAAGAFRWLSDPGWVRDLRYRHGTLVTGVRLFHPAPELGIGEIGLNKTSRNELKALEMHVDLAARHGQLILVHTPHLEDKLKGTRLILDVLKNDRRIQPGRVIIDHVEEHTVELVLNAGFWAGMTLYPETKCTAARAADIIELYGTERLWMNSACDWGVSVPLAVPHAALEMRRRGHGVDLVDRMIYQNPLRFLSQSPNFKPASG